MGLSPAFVWDSGSMNCRRRSYCLLPKGSGADEEGQDPIGGRWPSLAAVLCSESTCRLGFTFLSLPPPAAAPTVAQQGTVWRTAPRSPGKQAAGRLVARELPDLAVYNARGSARTCEGKVRVCVIRA